MSLSKYVRIKLLKVEKTKISSSSKVFELNIFVPIKRNR